MPFPELNLKQAWLIPSATALPNPNGTAPGWFVDAARRPGHRRPARSAARDAPDVGRPRRCPASGALGLGCRGRVADATGWRASANRRSRTCSARRSCGRRTRSSRPTPGSRPSTSGSRPWPTAAATRRRPRRRRPPRSSWAASATTSGRPARRPGAEAHRGAPRRARLDAGHRRDRDRREPRRAARRRAVAPLRRSRSPPEAPARAARRARRRRGRPTARRRRRRRGRRARALRPAGARARRRDVGMAVRAAADRRHGGLDRDRHAARRATRPAAGLPDRPDGPLAGGPRGGRDPARDPARPGRDRLTATGRGRLAARGGDQSRQVGDHDPLAVEPDQPVVARTGRAACSRSGACSRPSRRARPGSARSEPDRAIVGGAVPTSSASRTSRAATRPVMSRKWSSSTWIVRRRSSPASDASRASRTAGSVAISSRNRSRGRTTVSVAREGRRRRRPRRAVEQRQLAEDVARAQGREDRLVAGLRRQRDLRPRPRR